MFRRPRLPLPAPVDLEDEEARPRAALLTRANALRAAGLVLGGLAWGAAVRLADSLPVDMGFVGFVLKAGVGLGFVLALVLLLLLRGFEVDRVALVALLAIGGATIGLGAGPTVVPPVVVTGDFTFVPAGSTGMPTTAGSAECEWAGGRWKVGALRTSPLAGLPTPHRLTIDLLRRRISLADEDGSLLLAVGNEAFATPPDAPTRGAGDRSGTLDLLLLQVGLESTPDDPNEVRGRLSWECPGPPGE